MHAAMQSLAARGCIQAAQHNSRLQRAGCVAAAQFWPNSHVGVVNRKCLASRLLGLASPHALREWMQHEGLVVEAERERKRERGRAEGWGRTYPSSPHLVERESAKFHYTIWTVRAT